MPDDPTPYYAGWGTLALVNAALASSMHRSGFAWLIVSLLVGPLATLFLWLAGPADGTS